MARILTASSTDGNVVRPLHGRTMGRSFHLDPQRYFPSDPHVRTIAMRLYGAVQALPIISPHGHTDPSWFSRNEPFEDAVSLLLWPDHYLPRMLRRIGARAGACLPSTTGRFARPLRGCGSIMSLRLCSDSRCGSPRKR